MNYGTKSVETINGRLAIVLQRNNNGLLVANLPGQRDDYSEQVEAWDPPYSEGQSVIVRRIDGREVDAGIDIYIIRQMGETDADAIERAGLDETNLLP